MTDTVQTDYTGESSGSRNAMGSHQHTTVVTRTNDGVLRNELNLRLRDTSWTISGWKACAVETVSIGLMVAGLFFVSMHGRDVVSSIGNTVTGVMRK